MATPNACAEIIVFEGDLYTGHRNIGKQNIKCNHRDCHDIDPAVFHQIAAQVTQYVTGAIHDQSPSVGRHAVRAQSARIDLCRFILGTAPSCGAVIIALQCAFLQFQHTVEPHGLECLLVLLKV